MKSFPFLVLVLVLSLGGARAQPSSAPTTAALSVNTSTGAITAPVSASTFFGNATNLAALSTALASTYQPLDADLTAIAALTTTSNGRSLLTASALTAAGLGLTNGATIDSWAAVTRASGFDTFTATPSGANLASLLTTALPASKGGTGLTALGTGVATALGNTTNATGGLVTVDGTATLTNKTLTSPIIASISNTGTLTLPTSTDTLVGRATTDTLTNKTLSLGSNTLTATSAQLATAVSDETGSGPLVFATSPTLTTPNIGAATGTSLTTSGAITATSASSGSNFAGLTVTNSSNTANSHSSIKVANGGTSGGSPWLNLSDTSTRDWYVGVQTGSDRMVLGTSVISSGGHAIRIDSSNNVAIPNGTVTVSGTGTSSTSGKMQVGIGVSTGSLQVLNTSSGSGAGDGLALELSGTQAYLWNYENGSLTFGANNTQWMVLNTVGQLSLSATTEATTAGAGSLTVAGGIYAAKKGIFGGNGTFGNDASGSHQIQISGGANATKTLFIDGYANGNSHKIQSNANALEIVANDGSGVDVAINLTSAGVRGVNVKGTSTNDNAATGYVGEYVSSTVSSGSAVSLTTATPVNVTSISLTAGDWDVVGRIHFGGGAITGTRVIASLNSVSVTLGGDPATAYSPTMQTASAATTLSIPTFRVSVTSTTIIYLVAQQDYTVGSPVAWGSMSARRVR